MAAFNAGEKYFVEVRLQKFGVQWFCNRKGTKPDNALWGSFGNDLFDAAKTVAAQNVSILDTLCGGKWLSRGPVVEDPYIAGFEPLSFEPQATLS